MERQFATFAWFGEAEAASLQFAAACREPIFAAD